MIPAPLSAGSVSPDDHSVRVRLRSLRGGSYLSEVEDQDHTLLWRHEFAFPWDPNATRERLGEISPWLRKDDEQWVEHLTYERLEVLLEADAAEEQPANPFAVRFLGSLLHDCLFGGLPSRWPLEHWLTPEVAGGGHEPGAPPKPASLRIELDDQEPALWRVPWEYLWHPQQTRPYAISRRLAVVREVHNLPKLRPPGQREQLRLLLAVANPADRRVHELDVEAAIDSVQAALSTHRVEFRLLDFCSRERLAEAVSDFQPQVLHLVCHGLADQHSSQLLFESAEGEGVLVSGDDLACDLATQRQLGLVILDGCLTALECRTKAYRSPATAILGQHVPCVLAAQHLVADATATVFARTFYRALARGASILTAVSAARSALGQDVRRAGWGTYALYSNVNRDFPLTFPDSKGPTLSRSIPKHRFGESSAPMPHHYVRPNRPYRAVWQAIQDPHVSCVLIKGDSGCGKSVLVSRVLARQPDPCLVLTLSGSRIAAPPGRGSDRFFEALASVLDPAQQDVVLRLQDPQRPKPHKLQEWASVLPPYKVVVVLDEFEHLLCWDGREQRSFGTPDLEELVQAIIQCEVEDCTFLFLSSLTPALPTNAQGRVITVTLPELTDAESQLLWGQRPPLRSLQEATRRSLASRLGGRPRLYWLFSALLENSADDAEALAQDPRLGERLLQLEAHELFRRTYRNLTHDEQRLLAHLVQRGPLDRATLGSLGFPESTAHRLRQLGWIERIELDSFTGNAGTMH